MVDMLIMAGRAARGGSAGSSDGLDPLVDGGTGAERNDAVGVGQPDGGAKFNERPRNRPHAPSGHAAQELSARDVDLPELEVVRLRTPFV